MQANGQVRGKCTWLEWLGSCREEGRLGLGLEGREGFGQRDAFWVKGRGGPAGGEGWPGLTGRRMGGGLQEG